MRKFGTFYDMGRIIFFLSKICQLQFGNFENPWVGLNFSNMSELKIALRHHPKKKNKPTFLVFYHAKIPMYGPQRRILLNISRENGVTAPHFQYFQLISWPFSRHSRLSSYIQKLHVRMKWQLMMTAAWDEAKQIVLKDCSSPMLNFR